MDDIQRTKLVGLRIKLTPEEFRFAEFYGQELCNGSPRDYLRMVLLQALSREMQREREIKARIKAEQELEANASPPPGRSWSLTLDDEIPF